jgi:hypothetical protein
MLYDCLLNTVGVRVSLANVILHTAGNSLMEVLYSGCFMVVGHCVGVCVSLANVILHTAGDSVMKYIVLEKDAVR